MKEPYHIKKLKQLINHEHMMKLFLSDIRNKKDAQELIDFLKSIDVITTVSDPWLLNHLCEVEYLWLHYTKGIYIYYRYSELCNKPIVNITVKELFKIKPKDIKQILLTNMLTQE